MISHHPTYIVQRGLSLPLGRLYLQDGVIISINVQIVDSVSLRFVPEICSSASSVGMLCQHNKQRIVG
jgi:hypothetical protein